MAWLRWVLVGAGLIIVSWTILIVLAKRLPPGLARELAAFLPACATTMRRLRRHPAVPRSARWLTVFALIWVISPIDLIPEFLPVIGPLDDVVVVALVLRYVARRIPPEVLFEAWPGEPRLLARLIGRDVPPFTAD
ncbi:MAG: YkvA family protein [Ilumatobacteraceae bacterium]